MNGVDEAQSGHLDAVNDTPKCGRLNRDSQANGGNHAQDFNDLDRAADRCGSRRLHKLSNYSNDLGRLVAEEGFTRKT